MNYDTDITILLGVYSGIGKLFLVIVAFGALSIFRYAISSKLAAKKAARQEKFSWDDFAKAAKALNPDAIPGAETKKAVFIPQTEGIGSTEGKGSSVRLAPAAAQKSEPQDRMRPRPEPVAAQPSGSMNFASTEGVGTSAYQSPVLSRTSDSQYGNIDRKLPADKLRAAIVMSEILAKPVSLRKRDARIGR